ncbi:MAG: glycine--tRNA ligase subunit beta [Nitrospirota bacterium]
MSEELLIEIGTEELPSNCILPILDSMEEVIKKILTENRISFGKVRRYSTPRRLVLYVNGVSIKQNPLIVEVIGPHRKIAYDKDGMPTRAAIGFAAGQGIKVDELKIKETKKGEYVYAVKKGTRRNTRIVLKELLPSFIDSISLPRSMRWDEEGKRFIRPIRWILSLFGEETISFKYGKIKSSNISYGHRFLCPEPFVIEDPESYLAKAEKMYVIADYKRRENIINEQLDVIAKEKGGIALKRENLLKNAVFMVEYPAAVSGSFEKKYLNLPREVIINAVAGQQGYFPVTRKNGRILPYFISIVNIKNKDMRLISIGSERVVRARLEDARFFFEEDQKTRLSERLESLKKVTFLEPVGSLYEKTERIAAISRSIASSLNYPYPAKIEEAAMLCKTDLVTDMVGEFPDLQGIMGREYAKLEGEDKDISDAIADHYLPRFAGDSLPDSDLSAILAIADRIDTITACIGLGMMPSGSEDPYALRRQAIGVIQILRQKQIRVSLRSIVGDAINLFTCRFNKGDMVIKREISNFFVQRMDVILRKDGYRYDIIDAVLSENSDDLYDSCERINSLNRFHKAHDFTPFIKAVKRISNILPSVINQENKEKFRHLPFTIHHSLINQDLLEEKEEKELYNLLVRSGGTISSLIKEYRYDEALREMAGFISPINSFFDAVLVMHKDKKLRDNRLSLLRYIKDIFWQFADFSLIVVEGM